jgi:hypothetical protein
MTDIRAIAQNYQLFLVDFPADLRPEHLDVSVDEQTLLFAGLPVLHTIIGSIYSHFAHLTPADGAHWADEDYCYRAIEGPVRLLWALGVAGRLAQGPDGLEIKVERAALDAALKRCSVKDPQAALSVLGTVGFSLTYRDADGLPCTGGYKKCVAVAVRHAHYNDSLLRAVIYYAMRLPQKKSGRKEKGPILEVLLRADFRPLLPGYSFHEPHLPATEEEVTRTFALATLDMWREIARFMASRHPEYRLFFRVPFIRRRRWVADYSTKDGDYGAWSVFIEEKGLQARIVFNTQAVPNLLEHITDLSPQFQETYLNSVACKDCSHCGKHVFYTHGDHVHRLCKSPWYASPFLSPEDLPDVERLVDLRLADIPRKRPPIETPRP